MPHTLSQAPQLSYPESLYVLDRSLEGYEHLYEKGDANFAVSSDMIGFTPEGHTKVWFHKNFGINQPEIERRYLPSTVREKEILTDLASKDKHRHYIVPEEEDVLVQNIFDVVGDRNEQGFWPPHLQNQFKSHRMSFNEARAIVRNEQMRLGGRRVNRVDLYRNVIVG